MRSLGGLGQMFYVIWVGLNRYVGRVLLCGVMALVQSYGASTKVRSWRSLAPVVICGFLWGFFVCCGI